SFDSLGVPISRSIWSDAQGQIALSGLPAGTYTDVVLELNGCQSLPATFLIQNSGVDAPQPILGKVVPLQSCDPPDGTFEVGGLDPGLSYLLSYIWDGMQQDDTLLFADPSGRLVLDSFPAGLYTSIEVIKNGCRGSLADVQLMTSLSGPPTIRSVSPDCGLSNGQLELSGITPRQRFNIALDSAGVRIARQDSSDALGVIQLENLPTGRFENIILMANGCSTPPVSVEIQSGLEIDATINTNPVRCFGEQNGFASVDVNNSGPDPAFAWSHDPLIDTREARNLMAGDYRVTITQSGFCTTIKDFQISQPSEIILTFNRSNVLTMGASDGAAEVLPSGGAGGYSYRWENGETTERIMGLSAGVYSVTVTDQNGCQGVDSIAVGEGCEPLLITITARDNIVCSGDSTGRLVATPTSGTAPFAYRWSHDPAEQDSIAEGLAAGNYQLTVTDANGCSGMFPFFEVTNENPPLVVQVVQNDATENMSDGSANASALGGVGGYTFAWSTGTDGPAIADLPEGNYWVRVTDELGCMDSIAFAIGTADEVCNLASRTSIAPITCRGGSDGGIRITPEIPSPNLIVTWSHDDGLRGNQAENLTAGDYQAFLRTSTACTDTLRFSIADPAPYQPAFSLTSDLCEPESGSFLRFTDDPALVLIDADTIFDYQSIPLEVGMYSLQTRSGDGCVFDTTFSVHASTGLNLITQDTQIKLGHSVALLAESFGDSLGVTFGWRVGDTILCQRCTSLEVRPASSQFFEFFVTDGECTQSEFVQIFVDRQQLFFIPNAFTPNGDGINDQFIVYDGRGLVREIRDLVIFDRVSRQIYQKDEFLSNQELPDFQEAFGSVITPAVFIYRLQVVLWDGSIQNVVGNFTVVE
ncbi:MAG: gliding motility-associated C-terminal domain-containing protein, partial [Saprospiraceae bacterium]|nr:gliding motility-associated C-terminal domain-containing protein [Saprospiraceae bacterium]